MPTSIEWTDATWNPTLGCSIVSPGCQKCYAAGVAHRAMQPAHEGLTIKRPGEPAEFNGTVRFLPDRLAIPLHWRKPRTVFVNSMSDLFHPGVTVDQLSQIWDVMVHTPQHTYQVLTKRPQHIARMLGPRGTGFYAAEGPVPCPQPNIWLGTSIESDLYVYRTRHLRDSPAKVKFLSLEPLLGRLPQLTLDGIDWVIVGAESGPGARPMDDDWVRDIRDKAVDAGIPFFFKQRARNGKKISLPELDGQVWDQMPARHVPEETP